MKRTTLPHPFAASITKAASRQTFNMIRFLVDRERAADAYRAYGYFRWVDDTLDANALSNEKRLGFLARQKSLLELCYQGASFRDATLEEQMLTELVENDHVPNSGLKSYLRNMMLVMEFDARRRGRLISQVELNEYTCWLATAVTEAMHYFIGHGGYAPRDESRYLAVTGAHIAHMLRDTFDDVQAGYYNIPREILAANHLQPDDIHNRAYRAWVQTRVQLARKCFQTGREYLTCVEGSRCKMAGFAYIARFEWLLDTIEREDYFLRPAYSERKSLATGLRMGLSILSKLIHVHKKKIFPQPGGSHLLRER